jgi:hypothetical protein
MRKLLYDCLRKKHCTPDASGYGCRFPFGCGYSRTTLQGLVVIDVSLLNQVVGYYTLSAGAIAHAGARRNQTGASQSIKPLMAKAPVPDSFAMPSFA